jgi:hypothetical protein
MKQPKKRPIGWLLAGIVVILLASVSGLVYVSVLQIQPIQQVQAQAGSLHGRPVRVRGRVVNAAGLGAGLYLLDDRTERIWVTTTGACPGIGTEVTVEGTLNKHAQLPALLGGLQVVTIAEARRR